ncbi:MAG: patatin-like phospholipase family protein [Phycisphaerales bacterium]|nr:patatin-like phospholipase family protein [Phycisphaerales bacterium]
MSIGRLAAMVAVLISGVLSGCGTPLRGHAVPLDAQDRAVVSELGPNIRTWGGVMNPAFMETLVTSVRREQELLAASGHTGPLPPVDFLAISGGGANGAFGAGLLCAWSETGTRPQFKVVTGISTGALTAPFVFAGPEYDHVLREVYTKTGTSDILTKRGILAAVYDDAMSDTKPLWKTLSKYVDQKLLDAIAAEYRKGRVLIIGTTNLDARRAVLWNVGEIAASGKPEALELVRKIMIASASIPGAFPPVLIDVKVDGVKYQEMHVDGGTMTQVFLYPPSLKLREEAAERGVMRERRAYVIRNARLDPEWAEVDRSTMTIAGRAIESLIQTQGLGDLYRIYLNAQRDGIDFNLAFIPADFKELSKEPFDPAYMTKLFDRGYQMMKKGYPWEKSPPGFEAADAAKP